MYFRPIVDLFTPPPKPTFDLFVTCFNVFGVSGPLGLLLLKTCERFTRIASNCDSQLLRLRDAIRKKGLQFGNPETIRENLRIDSRGSGHPRFSRKIVWTMGTKN